MFEDIIQHTFGIAFRYYIVTRRHLKMLRQKCNNLFFQSSKECMNHNQCILKKKKKKISVTVRKQKWKHEWVMWQRCEQSYGFECTHFPLWIKSNVWRIYWHTYKQAHHMINMKITDKKAFSHRIKDNNGFSSDHSPTFHPSSSLYVAFHLSVVYYRYIRITMNRIFITKDTGKS